MRIIVLILSLILLAAPCLAGPLSFDDSVILAAVDKDKGKKDQPRGKVVIKGKGGKVTDVDKKPKKNDKQSQ